RLKDGTFASFSTADGLAHGEVRAIYEDRHGTLWIATDAGVNFVKGDQISSIGKGGGLSNVRVFAIAEDREGVLWIATKAGPKMLRGGEFVDVPGSASATHAAMSFDLAP